MTVYGIYAVRKIHGQYWKIRGRNMIDSQLIILSRISLMGFPNNIL